MSHSGELPAADDRAVRAFLRKWHLAATPTVLPYIDYGYDAAWCHVSAKHKAISSGGRRVHGWALWKFESLIIGEHHSVWQPEGGGLVDITPPSNGGDEILFVQDDEARIEESDGYFQLFTERTGGEEIHWLWQGKPTDYSNWPCPKDKTDLIAYSTRLDLPVDAIVTDEQHG